jgi:hypothetical protein
MWQCPMESGIIEMEESDIRKFLRLILCSLFVEIGQDFFDKEITIEYFLH